MINSHHCAEKTHRLGEPVVTAGTRLYSISSQNGLYPDSWAGHVPNEMWGIWAHPIKLFDGVWFGILAGASTVVRWLGEATMCRVGLGWTEYHYQVGPLEVVRRDCVPDDIMGLVSEIRVRRPMAETTEVALVVLARSDLRPAWLGERANMHAAPDQARIDEQGGFVVFVDGQNPWAAVAGATTPPREIQAGPDLWAVQQTEGSGYSARLTYPLTFDADGSAVLTFLLAGSAQSEADAVETYHRLHADHAKLAAEKQAQTETLARTSYVTTPEAEINEALLWTKLNCQMLARNVPPHGLGAGAGLPVYPWWFGIDTEYAVLPMLQAGLFDLTRETLQMLKRVSVATNPDEPGRVIHEMSTTGVVFNPGNMVETPAFVRAVHQYWQWTGDQEFLADMYSFCKQGLLDYALRVHDSDGDLCPSGRSIIETLEMHAGFECIDVASYTWEALIRLADLAPAAGDAAIVPDLLDKANTLGRRLREEWWLDDENLFADIRATQEEVHAALANIEARALADDAHPAERRQAEHARAMFTPELERSLPDEATVERHWLLRHWVVLCPVEVGVASPDQADRLLRRMTSDEFSNEWGLCLHPERRTAMSISAGMLGLAAARYGHTRIALDVARRLAASLPYHMPGAISEALPDQWCFIQLWSALGVISPVVEDFLGITPRVAEQRLRVVPNLPRHWDRAEVQRLRIGGAFIDVVVEQDANSRGITVAGDAMNYTIEIGCYLPGDRNVDTVSWNGETVPWRHATDNAGRCAISQVRGAGTLRIRLKDDEGAADA
jgi:glycogen debranching enzyme